MDKNKFIAQTRRDLTQLWTDFMHEAEVNGVAITSTEVENVILEMRHNRFNRVYPGEKNEKHRM